MDLQRLFDAMSAISKQERSKYHMTLGNLIDVLEAANDDAVVKFDNDELGHPGDLDSYRGYYSDLAFRPTTAPITVGFLKQAAAESHGATLTGYNGGEFFMDSDTPLWVSAYGCASGIAIVGACTDGDTLILETKQVD